MCLPDDTFFAWLDSNPNWEGIDGSSYQRLRQFAAYAADPKHNCDTHFKTSELENNLRSNESPNPRLEVREWIRRRIIVPYAGVAGRLCFWDHEVKVRLVAEYYLAELNNTIEQQAMILGELDEPMTRRDSMLLDIVKLSNHALWLDVLCRVISDLDRPFDILRFFMPSDKSDTKVNKYRIQVGKKLVQRCKAIQPITRDLLRSSWREWEHETSGEPETNVPANLVLTSAQQVWSYEALYHGFSMIEMRELGFYLEVEWEDIKGKDKKVTALEFIQYMSRLQRAGELINLICKSRPETCKGKKFTELFPSQ